MSFVYLVLHATAQVHAAIEQGTPRSRRSPSILRPYTCQRTRLSVDLPLRERRAVTDPWRAIGEFTVDEALKTLLSDSGLEYKFVDDNTVSIFPRMRRPTPSDHTNLTPEGSSGSDSKRSSGEYTRLAQTNQGMAQSSSTVGGDVQGTSGSSGGPPGLTEIVVTAQKKSERLQDVPIPVSVLDTQALAETNKVLLRDYYDSVPGLDVVPNYVGVQNVSIRVLAGAFEPQQ